MCEETPPFRPREKIKLSSTASSNPIKSASVLKIERKCFLQWTLACHEKHFIFLRKLSFWSLAYKYTLILFYSKIISSSPSMLTLLQKFCTVDYKILLTFILPKIFFLRFFFNVFTRATGRANWLSMHEVHNHLLENYLVRMWSSMFVYVRGYE